MNNDKSINKPFVILSFLVLTFGVAWDCATGPIKYEEPKASIISAIVMLISPLLVIWLKALWNEIIPRITSWRRITFVEAAGLMAISYFLGS